MQKLSMSPFSNVPFFMSVICGPRPCRGPRTAVRGTSAPDVGDLLDSGLRQLGLAQVAGLADRISAYVELLCRWNRTYNLVASATRGEILVRHVFDSLAVLPHVRGPRLLDVGTGAGLPGLILAMAAPQIECVVMDANSKKTRFCLHVVAALDLANVQVVHARSETYAPTRMFDTVVARALGPLPSLLSLMRLCTGNGRLLALKGARAPAELEALGLAGECAALVRIAVPGLAAKRYLVVVQPGLK